MAQKTDIELTAQSDVIRNEAVAKANTKIRVADMVLNLVDSKINKDSVDTSTTLDTAGKSNPDKDAVKTYIANAIAEAIADLRGSAPGLLDTLGEISDALSDDASFSSTVINLLAGKLDKLIIANRQTGSYTLVLTDADKLVEMNIATANNLTVPPNSSVAFAIGTSILICQYGAGQTTIVAGSGVTIRSSAGLKLSAQYAGAALVKIATDEWYLQGSLSV